MRSFFSCSAALIKFLQEDVRGQKALFRHLHHPGFITASQGCAGGAGAGQGAGARHGPQDRGGWCSRTWNGPWLFSRSQDRLQLTAALRCHVRYIHG